MTDLSAVWCFISIYLTRSFKILFNSFNFWIIQIGSINIKHEYINRYVEY